MRLQTVWAVARFELQRKKTQLHPAAVAAILVVLLLFGSSFYYLSTHRSQQTLPIYSVTPTGGPIDQYFTDSLFLVDLSSRNTLIELPDGYRLEASRSIDGLAARMALVELLKERSLASTAVQGYTPQYLTLINVTSVFREEVLLGIDQGRQRPNASRYQVENIISAVDEDPLSIETVGGGTPPPDEQPLLEETNQDVIQQARGTPLDSNEQSSPLAPGNQSSDLPPEGLESAFTLSSLEHIQDILLIVQIIFIFNFVGALVGNAFFDEKINQRSSLLFVARLHRSEFLIGKILPYFCIGMLGAIIILALQYPRVLLQWPAYVIMTSLFLLYIGISTINGLIARSNKEYSFLNVFAMAGLSMYLLVPTFIANFSALGYASLFTPLLLYAQSSVVRSDLLLFLLPAYTAVAVMLLYIASRAWHFELLYRIESPLSKFLTMLKDSLRKPWNYLIYGFFSVAAGWLLQLGIIIVFLVTRFDGKTIAFLLLAAWTEEIVRNAGFFAHMRYLFTTKDDISNQKKQYLRPRRLLLISALTGLGFMVAEKVVVVLAIAPFLEGYTLFITAGLVVPWGIHTLLSYLYLMICKYSAFMRRNYLLLSAVLGFIHAAINYLLLFIVQVRPL